MRVSIPSHVVAVTPDYMNGLLGQTTSIFRENGGKKERLEQPREKVSAIHIWERLTRVRFVKSVIGVTG